MKIAMLVRRANLYTHRRLVEAAEAQGHEVKVFDTFRVYIDFLRIGQESDRGKILPRFDAVIPCIGASVAFHGLAVLRQFEVMGLWPLNELVAFGHSRDKSRRLQLLARRGIGLPVTGFAHNTRDTEDLIRMAGGTPIVIKLLQGMQGVGVILGETSGAAKSMIEAFQGGRQNTLVQEFIKSARGVDIRGLVMGERSYAR